MGLRGYADDFIQRNFDSFGRRHEIDVGGCDDQRAHRLQRQVLLFHGSALELNGTAVQQASRISTTAASLIRLGAGRVVACVLEQPHRLLALIEIDPQHAVEFQSLNKFARRKIAEGCMAISITISSGGREYVAPGGIASGATISSGGSEFVEGGTAIGTTISGNAAQFVQSGAAIGTTLSSGGVLLVFESGITISTTISSGGVQEVYYDGIGGGIASGTTISSGG
jgi:autotransporter passenger strand-loop-strand repeat protein